MRWRQVIPAFAAALLLTAASAWAAGSAIEEAILKLEARRIQAMIAVDLPTLDGILADDLTYVHSNGKMESKAEFLARLKSGDLKYRAMPRQEVQVRVLGCAAVVTGRAGLEVQSGGETLSLPLRFTDVYVERDGRWRMVAWHSSRLP